MAINVKLYDTKDITLTTANKYCDSNIKVSVDSSGLYSRYILKGKSILGVEGELLPSETTNDATAKAADILKGKTAWVKGRKIKGTIATYTGKIKDLTENNALFDVEEGEEFTATLTSDGLEIVNGVVVGIGTCTDADIYLGKELFGIAAEAFKDCNQIESITIENGMTYIESRAFSGCANLTSVVIPASVTNISEAILSGCMSLERLTIPYAHKKLATIEHNIGYFFGESYYENSEAITQHILTLPNVVTSKTYYLPISLYEVTLLGGPLNTSSSYYGSPFENCSMICIVNIGKDTVLNSTSINPFKGCANLHYLSVEEGHSRIDSRNDCNAIIETSTKTLLFGCADTTIPTDATKIASGAFNYCTSLTAITIPANITDIGKNAFMGCSGLNRIVVDAGNTKYDSRNNCNAIIETSKNTLLCGCRNTIIPNTVTSIGYSAFEDITSLSTITLPASVTSIGYNAFSGCTELISVQGLENITMIDSYAFNSCSSLRSVDLSSFSGQISYGCFNECTSLASIKFGKNITSIDDHAFGSCKVSEIIFPEGSKLDYTSYHCLDQNNNLKYVVFPDGMTVIGECTFYLCRNLEKVIIPKSVTTIEDGAFWCSDHLQTFYKGTKEEWDQIKIEGRNYALNETFYSDCIVYYYSENNPHDAQYGYWHFDTDGVTPVIWDSEVDVNELHYSVGLDIRGDTLYGPGGCTSKIIKVPEGVTKILNPTVTSNTAVIGRYSRCTTMILPESLRHIGKYGLSCGSNLTTLYIPSTLTSLEESALSDNKNLQYIVFPEGITTLPYNVIAGCSGLVGMVIPKTVTTIEVCIVTSGNYDLYYNGSIADWQKITIKSGQNFASINPLDHAKNFYVLDSNGSVEFEGNKYTPVYEYTLSADITSLNNNIRPWGNLESLKVAAGNTKYDSRNNCNAIINTSSNSLVLGCKNTKIPEGVTSIGSQAFYNCRDLKSIALPTSLTSIGSGAFFGCTNLSEIIIPDGKMTKLPSYAFYGIGITQITIPGSIKVLEGYSIASCTKLERVVLNEGVTTINKYAFSYSRNMTSIVLPKSLTTIGDVVFWEGKGNDRPSALTDVYYRGSKEDWAKIDIGSSNNVLDRVRIHYNYVD